MTIGTPPTPPPPAPAPAPAQKKWTIMLYSAADNNLTSAMLDNVRDIETVGSDSYTNLIAQVDQGGSIGANRYYLQKATNAPPSTISSPPVQQLGDVNMSDPKTLSDFIQWGIKNYPAQHYMVIVSDHGNGWRGAVEDDSQNGWMALPQIQQGFDAAQQATGTKLDIVGFDCCLMASTEVADQLKGNANYLVVSEQTEGAAGWPYSKILNPTLLTTLKSFHLSKIQVEPKELAELSVRQSAGTQDILPTMTAVDTAKVPDLVTAVDHLGSAIARTRLDTGKLAQAANDTQDFTGYKDAWDFADRVDKLNTPGKAGAPAPAPADADLQAATTEVKSAIQNAVIAEEHSPDYPGAHGITLEIGTYSPPGDDYKATQLAQDTHWPDALAKLSGGSSGAASEA